EGAEQDLRRAVEQAQAGGDPGTRAQAMVRLVWVVGRDRSRYQEARALGIQAGAVLELIGAPPLLHADLDNNLGTVSRTAGALDEALEHHQRALERRREVLGDDHPDVGRSLTHIGNVLTAQGRLREAEDHLRRGLAQADRTLGPNHPSVAVGLMGLAYCLDKQDRVGEALALQRRALRINERAFGPDHPSSLHARLNLAKLAQKQGLHAQTRALLADVPASSGPGSAELDPHLETWLETLGRSELHLGHRAAVQHLGQVLEIMQAQGKDELRLARPRFALAQALRPDDPERARALAEAALQSLRVAIERAPPDQRSAPVLALRDEIEAWLSRDPRSTGSR
ncbi:MAG: tetratricopeptide repeat protein, partial [Myxococcales bacterium]|nr:tetratricopeptide repeat protein [Myxococcales bacterium]